MARAMANDKKAGHQAAILDQFTRQAVPFSNQPAHSQEIFLELLLQMSGVGPADTVLDVACGPGLVALAFAARARHVTGIDLTPAMITRAQEIQQERKLTNLTWQVGDVLDLPYPDASFSLVVSRYAFHHFLEPQAVFAEMVRVCNTGEGRVLVADVAMLPEKREAFDRVEKLRDPSHVRNLAPVELSEMAARLNLRDLRTRFFKTERNLEVHLQASFPNPGDKEKIRKIFREDIGKDDLGVGAHWRDKEIYFAYPIMVLVGRKAGD
ncbi:MAG: class I SAM-dependent methyltransferase [Desulfobaccales bacterium]